MPLYFFDLRAADGQMVPDVSGLELADDAAAVREAADAARGFASDRKLGGYDFSGCYFKIRSELGSITVPAFVTGAEAV